jgi:hypothetical protein
VFETGYTRAEEVGVCGFHGDECCFEGLEHGGALRDLAVGSDTGNFRAGATAFWKVVDQSAFGFIEGLQAGWDSTITSSKEYAKEGDAEVAREGGGCAAGTESEVGMVVGFDGRMNVEEGLKGGQDE